ncbi:polysaccharide deacetylase family protein [Paenibacillus pectinilyticus]|nr:polysaccharide deacetylase family protein [Paenibacillus pectinilyticus]
MKIIAILSICFVLLQPAAHAAPKKDRAYYEGRGDVVWEIPTSEKKIALTFDDGPDPADTPLILDLLKQYNAKATFFVIGNKVEKYPDIARREVLEGHEIANHTYSHKYFRKNIPSETIQKEILDAENAIIQATSVKPRLFRPPGGFYNENVIHVSKNAGNLVIMWSWHQDTEDWQTPGIYKIVNKVSKNTRNGDIILFHDYVEGKTQTIAALKQILPLLKERGYEFVTVSELLTYRNSTSVDNTNPIK